MTCLCGHRGFAGPSACVLEKGHKGDHEYGDYQQALAIAAAKELHSLREQLAAAQAERDTAWAQAHRLALELECLIMDTKDNAVVSKWWDSAFEAIEEYHTLKPGAAEEAEAWVKMRKAGI